MRRVTALRAPPREAAVLPCLEPPLDDTTSLSALVTRAAASGEAASAKHGALARLMRPVQAAAGAARGALLSEQLVANMRAANDALADAPLFLLKLMVHSALREACRKRDMVARIESRRQKCGVFRVEARGNLG
jgi:hypothetical protein